MAKKKKGAKKYANDTTLTWLVEKHGDQWEVWRGYAENWLRDVEKSKNEKRIALCKFFEEYLIKKATYSTESIHFFEGHNGHLCSSEEFLKIIKSASPKNAYLHVNRVVEFVDWVVETHFSTTDVDGSAVSTVVNPLRKITPKGVYHNGRTKDLAFEWLTSENGEQWEEWRSFAEKWLSKQEGTNDLKRQALCKFFDDYLIKKAQYSSDLVLFFEGHNGHLCSSYEFLKSIKKKAGKSSIPHINRCVEFVDWIVIDHFSSIDKDGFTRQLVTNPLEKITKSKNRDGRSSDKEFLWLTKTHGEQWEQWRRYAQVWLKEEGAVGTDEKLRVICALFSRYLVPHVSYASEVELFFKGINGHICSTEEYLPYLEDTINDSNYLGKRINIAADFLDWVLEQDFSERLENGLFQPRHVNPLKRINIEVASENWTTR